MSYITDNALIAQYMGLKVVRGEDHLFYIERAHNKRTSVDLIGYETNWNKIMPVVEKIVKETKFDIGITTEKTDFGSVIYRSGLSCENGAVMASGTISMIQQVYSCVVQYLRDERNKFF